MNSLTSIAIIIGVLICVAAAIYLVVTGLAPKKTKRDKLIMFTCACLFSPLLLFGLVSVGHVTLVAALILIPTTLLMVFNYLFPEFKPNVVRAIAVVGGLIAVMANFTNI